MRRKSARRTSGTVADRFWAKVRRSDGCWEWTAARTAAGYGAFGVTSSSTRLAHRVAYELEVGPIPDGQHVHHACENTLCVRPSHLRAVSPREHIALSRRHSANQTECRRGHPFEGENIYVVAATGARRCRECVRIRERAYTKRRAAAR